MTPTATLTTQERLALSRLGSNPKTATTRKEFAEILDISPPTASGLLSALVDKGYAARTPAMRKTRFWRIHNAGTNSARIQEGATIDSLIANLQARAARADVLEKAVHKILNILVELGQPCLHRTDTTSETQPEEETLP